MKNLFAKFMAGLLVVAFLGACAHSASPNATVQGLKPADSASASAGDKAEGCGMKDSSCTDCKGCKDCKGEKHSCGASESCGCNHKKTAAVTKKTSTKKAATKKAAAPVTKK